MPDDLPLLAVTHLLAAGVGALCSYLVTVTAAGRREAPPGGQAVRVHHRPHLTPRDYVSVTVIAASLFVVAIGVLAWWDSRADEKQRACFAATVDRLSQAVDERGRANEKLDDAQAKLDAAQTARDQALDSIILVVIGSRETPPTADDADFGRALSRFADARGRLVSVQNDTERARARADRIRENNPVPPATAEVCR